MSVEISGGSSSGIATFLVAAIAGEFYIRQSRSRYLFIDSHNSTGASSRHTSNILGNSDRISASLLHNPHMPSCVLCFDEPD